MLRLLRLIRGSRARAVALGALALAAVVPMSGCAAAARAEASPASPEDAAEPSSAQAETMTPAPPPAPGDGRRMSREEPLAADTPHPARPGGPRGPEPAADGRVRLVLPSSSALEPLALERRPSLPERSALAVVCARDARLCNDRDGLLALGRELDGDPGLEKVIFLGDVDGAEIDLRGLARLARERSFDLLLVDVRRDDDVADRAGLLVHAATGAVLGVYEVRGGELPRESGGSARDDLVERVAEAYARMF